MSFWHQWCWTFNGLIVGHAQTKEYINYLAGSLIKESCACMRSMTAGCAFEATKGVLNVGCLNGPCLSRISILIHKTGVSNIRVSSFQNSFFPSVFLPFLQLYHYSTNYNLQNKSSSQVSTRIAFDSDMLAWCKWKQTLLRR
jgi:hypothetical protein